MHRGLFTNRSKEGLLRETDLSEVDDGVVHQGCTMSGRNQSVINRSLAMENFSFEIDFLAVTPLHM